MNFRDIFGKRIRVNIEDVRTDPNLCPKFDKNLDSLMEQAYKGEIPVYFAAIPLALCVPYDLDYRPDLHSVGAEAIHKFAEDARNEKYHYMIVYPRGKWFIVSDDYITLFATFEGLPDYVPCWILGRPDNEQICDLQGPIALDDVKKILGFE